MLKPEQISESIVYAVIRSLNFFFRYFFTFTLGLSLALFVPCFLGILSNVELLDNYLFLIPYSFQIYPELHLSILGTIFFGSVFYVSSKFASVFRRTFDIR